MPLKTGFSVWDLEKICMAKNEVLCKIALDLEKILGSRKMGAEKKSGMLKMATQKIPEQFIFGCLFLEGFPKVLKMPRMH